MTLIRVAPPNKTLKGHKLLITDPRGLPDAAVDRLHNRFPDLQVQRLGEDADDSWRDATVAVGSTSSLPSIDQAAKLELFQLTSAGADGLVGNPVFDDTKISFCTASGVHGPQISEWVVSTFLAFQHRLPEYLENQQQGKWKTSKHPSDDSVGQRVGILGYGSVGRQVARLCKAMGMTVHAYTLHPRRTPSSRRDDSYAPPGLGDPAGALPDRWFAGGSTADLHAFLGSGLDLLVVALPLTPQTRGLIAKPEFDILRARKAFVSNIARGPIVDTHDLIDALENGAIRGAALDVTDPEPLPDRHPLWRAKNIIITPHVSGATSKYMERVFEVLMANLTRFSNGERLMNLINRKEGY
ncbi:NAD(P)-binding domain [Cordyceps militaris]|uniref:NAD(P)-binding domain n=1 Tax=Cordyceps militaris TaxID=73501 RepID=A0A2H4SN52_CORMI|nr:NAD(P)-binding domain [Cordyceps militaris]